MWTRSRFLNEYVPGLFTVSLDRFMTQRAVNMYDKLCTIKTSAKKKEEDSIRSGLGLPTVKGEGAPIGYDIQIEGPKQSWVHNTYAMGVRLTEEAIDDNLYHLNGGGNADDLQDIFDDLGRSMATNPEVYVAKFFNSATATTYHAARDAVAFASTAHYRLDGSTFSNKATSTDLTYSTFWANLVSAENQYDHRSLRVKKNVNKLWVPPQLERAGLEVLKSSDRPDSANRAINAYAKSGRSIQLMVWPEMTDEDMWVLQCEGRGIIFFWRRKTRFAREREFQTGDMMCKSDQRFSAEIADERDFYFNIPA
jgi:hypothetical protein